MPIRVYVYPSMIFTFKRCLYFKTHLMRKSKALTMLLFFVKIFNTLATQITSLIRRRKVLLSTVIMNVEKRFGWVSFLVYYTTLNIMGPISFSYYRDINTRLKCVLNVQNNSLPVYSVDLYLTMDGRRFLLLSFWRVLLLYSFCLEKFFFVVLRMLHFMRNKFPFLCFCLLNAVKII